ncbi:acyl-CoA dehydrogenase family protein [Amycolatopsis keratiniphila]|uniref:acyl-CoA dehydrogenase family protein n=1 Tax=Amycolatopsis keratiniphila TaxID=129921 RepID=UPI00087CAF7B|nr:acyl-CoA dehydrogenase family protein [Amycolatopsis keratiniphila]OLZ59672.1 acyl-CoA dehydrogenase [Amycolatopsis keratiniphila subsp. nogabecina]SDU54659.1 Acyl-CoA dehydrogenase [Amycolatopsis keratiniphila]
MTDLVTRAQALADDLLFPAATEVDLKGEVPSSHFDALAAEGFYGLAAPKEAGGPGADLPTIVQVLETLAGGCLSTMFTWIQHHGLVAALTTADNAELRDRYLPRLVSGELKAGAAFAAVIPTPPRLRAERVEGGYLLDGEAPFVSGWGVIDLLQLCARDGDTVVSAIIDPVAGEQLEARPLDLVAAQGTATVHLVFTRYFLPDDRVYGKIAHADFVAGNTFASRLNGCAPLGLAARAARLIEELGKPGVAAGIRAEIDVVRGRLDAALADPPSLPAARAAGAELAFRAAGALVAANGSTSVLAGRHPQRLVREATFLLVAASRPEIKSGLLELFSRN